MFTLSKFTQEDWPLFAELVFDPDVMQMNLGRVFSAEEAEGFFSYMMESNAQPAPVLGWYKVMLSESRTFIGLFGAAADGDRIEIEYMLPPHQWGKGYATRLIGGQIRALKQAFPRKTIAAMTDPANLASIRVLEKNGFVWQTDFLNEDGECVSLYEI